METLSKIQVSIAVLVLILVIPAFSYAADGKIKIGQTPSTIFPIVIDTSGSYILTSNLQVSTTFNCIQIAADNVTLDLNGFALTGPGTGSAGHGIYVNGYNNITIMNGTVRDFMSTGIYFLSSTKIQLKDLKCTNNGQRGIYVENATVANCIAEENGNTGIRAYYSTVRDCTSNDNTEDGIDVLSSTVLNCQAYYNNNRGIYSRRSSLTNCTITFSGDHGIEASDSTITNCTSYGNNNPGSSGINLTNSIATNCTANENSKGFYIMHSTLTNCAAKMNSHCGIEAWYSTITSCTANMNDYEGFDIWRTTITNCTAFGNYYIGINAGDNNRIEANNIRGNGLSSEYGFGIYLGAGARDNYVIKNTASDNYSGNFQDDGLDNYMPLTGDNANYGF